MIDIPKFEQEIPTACRHCVSVCRVLDWLTKRQEENDRIDDSITSGRIYTYAHDLADILAHSGIIRNISSHDVIQDIYKERYNNLLEIYQYATDINRITRYCLGEAQTTVVLDDVEYTFGDCRSMARPPYLDQTTRIIDFKSVNPRRPR